MSEKKSEQDYKNWLRETGKKDTKLNREWYFCSEEKRSEYIKEHKSWWKNC